MATTFDDIGDMLEDAAYEVDLTNAYVEAAETLREHFADYLSGHVLQVEFAGQDYTSSMDEDTLIKFAKDLDYYMFSEVLSGWLEAELEDYKEDRSSLPYAVMNALDTAAENVIDNTARALSAEDISALALEVDADERVDFIEDPAEVLYDRFSDAVMDILTNRLLGDLEMNFRL